MSSKRFERLAYDSIDDFIYGIAKKPVVCKNGMVICGGLSRNQFYASPDAH